MASLAFGVVGAYFFGPIGYAVGSLVGNLLFPTKSAGPKLTDLKLQDSSYGKMIPMVYGVMRVPGILIWETDLQEHKHTSGGKGGPEVTTYSYSASFAMILAEGPADHIAHIWSDADLIYARDGGDGVSADLPCTFYPGDELQLPDPVMEAELGVGNVPGHRGMCYVVFDEFDLSRYGNRVPNLNFELVMKGGEDSPIFKVAEYHSNDDPRHWEYFAVGPGYVGTRNPMLSKWSLDGSDIRVYSYPDGAVYTYTNPGLVESGTDTPGPDEADLNFFTGTSIGWRPMRQYVYNDNSTTPLWEGVGDYTIGSTTTDCALGSGSVSISGPNILTAKNFAGDAGIPAAEHHYVSALSADGRTLLVTTRAGSSGFPTKWYRIIDGVVASSGTCASGLNIVGSGPFPTTAGTSPAEKVNVLENNGDYLWCFVANNSYQPKIGGTNYSGTIGWITLFKIDGGILDWNSASSACSLTNPNQTGQPFPTIISPADGYAGVQMGASMALFSRLTGTAPTTLAEIVQDQSVRCGLDPSEIDVTALTDIVDGFKIDSQQAGRENIDPTRSAYFYDGVESSGVMKFVKRGGDVAVTIIDDYLSAHVYDSGDPPPLLEVKRTQETDLPQQVSINYVRRDADYLAGSQMSQRQVVQSQQKRTLDLQISMGDPKAKQIANVLLYAAWEERTQATFITSRKYVHLEPTDVVSIEGYELRIISKTELVDTTIRFDAVRTNKGMWTQQPVGSAGSGSTSNPVGAGADTRFVPLDIPLVRDEDSDDAFYAAMCGTTAANWRGANLYKSSDGGATYAQVAAAGGPNVIGKTVDALGDFGGGNIFDELNTVSVAIGDGGGTLASAAELAVLNGANVALIGMELIQFKNAVLMGVDTSGDQVYKLSGLLRGRRGTEWAMPFHLAGDLFVLLQPTPAPQVPTALLELEQTRLYKAVSFGGVVQATTAVPFIDRGMAVAPYSPARLGGGVNSTDDVIINWARRTRRGGGWNDLTDVALAEPTEEYLVQIWDSTFTQIARIVTGVTAETFTYTAAMQVADFGATQLNIYVTVGQIGRHGVGQQAKAVIPAAGASDDVPLNPIAPPGHGAPPPDGGSTCPAPVQTDTLAWVNTAQVLNTDFEPGVTWLISFTTGATDNVKGQLSAVEYGGQPAQYDTLLSASPCGPPVGPGATTSGQNAPSFPFHVGSGNPHPAWIPTLAINTKYYLSMTTSIATATLVTLYRNP